MVKDASIAVLIGELHKAFDPKELLVADHWEADLFSVGFMRRGDSLRLLYVSTRDEPAGAYTVVQEQQVDGVMSNSAAIEHLSADDVARHVVTFLGVAATS